MSSEPPTEQPHPRSGDLGAMGADEVVDLMDSAERGTLEAVFAASGQITEAARVLGRCVRRGGRVVLLGSGTSGRIALTEVSELRPTFGVPSEMFTAWIAGGEGPAAIASSEDDRAAAAARLAEAGIARGDCVIGLAASGTTPFVVAGLSAAASAGAWTCGIANNPGTTVLEAAEHPILLDTGPELLTGSTRLQAATAQKLALNRITTAAMVEAGRIVGNRMVDMRVTISKLRKRAIRTVSDLAGVGDDEALRMLEAEAWEVRKAIARAGALDRPRGGGDRAAASPPEEVSIRAAERSDAAQARALALAEVGRSPEPARLARILGSYPAAVAVEDGRLIGFAFGVPLSPDLIDFANLLVARDRRNRGIGIELIDRFEHLAAETFGAIIAVPSALWSMPEGVEKRSSSPLLIRLGYASIHSTEHTAVLIKELRGWPATASEATARPRRSEPGAARSGAWRTGSARRGCGRR